MLSRKCFSSKYTKYSVSVKCDHEDLNRENILAISVCNVKWSKMGTSLLPGSLNDRYEVWIYLVTNSTCTSHTMSQEINNPIP